MCVIIVLTMIRDNESFQYLQDDESSNESGDSLGDETTDQDMTYRMFVQYLINR